MNNFATYNEAAENCAAGIAYTEHGQNWENIKTAIAEETGNNQLILTFADNSRIIYGDHTDVIIPNGYTEKQVFHILRIE